MERSRGFRPVRGTASVGRTHITHIHAWTREIHLDLALLAPQRTFYPDLWQTSDAKKPTRTVARSGHQDIRNQLLGT